ncbi:MAG TPA: TetR/AcrR family transcriptional regulator [Xanthobacteraceae bacterium]|nr:TetR/AcrR family transcriptional regulator [Xanthobacteraceae bacterium]
MDIEITSQVENPERVEWRREQVVTAAVERFAVNGYHGTTIKEIAETANVSPGLIYSYVKDKEELLLLVFMAIFKKYREEIPKQLEGLHDPLQRFAAALRAYCQSVASNVGATVVGYQESKALSPERRKIVKALELETNELIAAPVRECMKAGYFRSVNVDLFTFRVVLFAHSWALKNWYFRDLFTLDGYIEEGLDLFLHAMLTPTGWQHWRSLIGGDEAAPPQRQPAKRRARSAKKK